MLLSIVVADGKRGPCSGYCWLGNGLSINQVIASTCTKGVEQCVRQRSPYGNNLGRGVQCACQQKNPPGIPFGRATLNGTIVPCDSFILSGDLESTTIFVDLNKNSGVVSIHYKFYTLVDTLSVFYQGFKLFQSSPTLNSTNTIVLPFEGTSKIITLSVFAPDPRSAWDLFVHCPI